MLELFFKFLKRFQREAVTALSYQRFAFVFESSFVQLIEQEDRIGYADDLYYCRLTNVRPYSPATSRWPYSILPT